MERFQGGPVFKAHRLLYHSTLGSRVIKKKKGRGQDRGDEGGAHGDRGALQHGGGAERPVLGGPCIPILFFNILIHSFHRAKLLQIVFSATKFTTKMLEILLV